MIRMIFEDAEAFATVLYKISTMAMPLPIFVEGSYERDARLLEQRVDK